MVETLEVGCLRCGRIWDTGWDIESLGGDPLKGMKCPICGSEAITFATNRELFFEERNDFVRDPKTYGYPPDYVSMWEELQKCRFKE